MQLPYPLRRLLPALLLALPLVARAQTPGVGIGTTAPDASAALDIVSSSKGALLPRVAAASAIASPATGLIVFQTNAPAGFYYNVGTPTAPSWQQIATAAGAAITASNGLSKTGQNIALGGTLAQNTTIDQGTNNLLLTGTGNLGVGTSSPTARLTVAQTLRVDNTGTSLYQTGQSASNGAFFRLNTQTFMLAVGTVIRQIDVYANGGTGTFEVFKGLPGGTALSSQTVTYTSDYGLTTVALATPVTVTAPGVYSFRAGNADYVAFSSTNTYAGGQAYSNAGSSYANYDLKFAVYYDGPSDATFYAAPSTVGINTSSPTAALDVAGSTRLRGLPTAGVVTTDAQGNLSSSSATAAFGSSFIQNTTTAQAGASFNIAGSGTVGSGLTVSGPTNINTGNGTTTIGGFGSTTTIGSSGFTRIGDNAGGTSIGSPGNTTTIGNGGFVRIGGSGGGTSIDGATSIGEDNNSATFIGTGSGSGAVTIGRSGGTVQVKSLPTAGVVTTDANGTLSSSSSVGAADATTASNGLTRTGQDVALGGTLTQNTTVTLGSSSLSVLGNSATLQISQPVGNGRMNANQSTGVGQSFTLPAGARITQVDVYVAQFSLPPSGSGTLTLYQGDGTGGAVLATQAATYAAYPAVSSLVLATPVVVGAAGSYSFSLGSSMPFIMSGNNVYAGGTAYAGATALALNDLRFTVYYTTPTLPVLYAGTSSNVGVGTSSPTAQLDVDGSTRLRGLTTAGLVTTDASGNLSSSDGGDSFIQNQTAADQSGSFRLTGSGALGGSLALGSTAAPAQRLSITSADNTASTDIVKVTSLNGASGVSLGYFGLRASGSNANDRLTLDAKGTGDILLGTGGGNGNVGIGTSSPAQKLDVSGSAAVSANLGIGTSSPGSRLSISPASTEAKITLFESGGTDHYGFGVSGGQLNYHVLSTSDQHVFWAKGRNASTGSVELMRIQGNGRVGIGTSSPAQTLDVAGSATVSGRVGIGVSSPVAPLHVSGNASVAASGTKVYFFQGSGTALGTDASTAARAVAAYFTGGQVFVNDYIVAGALNVTSDRRIKRVIGLSDRAADLALLNRVRITDYTYIDQHANTDKVVKKVIAQEVQQLLPAAVSQSRQAIPNVYERAARVRFADGHITLTTSKPHELPTAGGTLRLYTPANQELRVAATVLDAHTVRFASTEAHADGLFVYGKYVDDFLSVDYDALTTLNVSATQELARQVAALQADNARLQAAATQAAADHADLQTLKEQMARLLGEAPAPAQARR
ncbi:tail fiber domain-containing protein [Hymenobacter sp. ASUV-10]|uniref:Tail fiber domain-containing protein n=1 Tax=Hymenobacter aranciens TaxID=3063996 RepID=A0ABT9BFW3_9BACT|nr:tail fiber domain-containing protein [Hymenobacter sp. ASUV-10]MDO7877160.1 tail fiber domain-containing protein [Hymenobacter sp. ASUV-10]